MTDLLMSIACSSVIVIIFKLFESFKVRNLQAIVANYFTAATMGFVISGTAPNFTALAEESWLPYAALTGLMFISLFNVMAFSAQKVGVAITAVANKMSFAIPVLFAFIVFSEDIGPLKWLGIVLALAGVYLTCLPKSRSGRVMWWPPLVLFLGGGALDTLLQYTEKTYVVSSFGLTYTGTLFLFAALLGTIWLTVQVLSKRSILHGPSWIAGILLGIPNFGSIYFLFRAIGNPDLPSSSVFPINNMGIVLLTAICGIIFFKEILSPKNWIGVLLSVAAILVIGFFG